MSSSSTLSPEGGSTALGRGGAIEIGGSSDVIQGGTLGEGGSEEVGGVTGEGGRTSDDEMGGDGGVSIQGGQGGDNGDGGRGGTTEPTDDDCQSYCTLVVAANCSSLSGEPFDSCLEACAQKTSVEDCSVRLGAVLTCVRQQSNSPFTCTSGGFITLEGTPCELEWLNLLEC